MINHRRLIVSMLGLGLTAASGNLSHAAEWVPEGTAHVTVETPEEIKKKMAWWREARFGMFIHWGLYAVPAGEWKGKPIPNLGEWILKNAQIPVAEYKDLAKQFNPTKFDAEAWVKAAKDAGMKYIVITSKHHDGFAMFKSAADPFNIVDATPFKRDPLQELAAACKKEGIRFGFYYSQDQDWTSPGGAVIGKMWDRAQNGSFAEYLRVKAVPQFRELLTQYQPAPDIIWFDTPTTDMTPELAQQFVDLLKQHPHIIWNERLGGKFKGNFRTPEQRIPANGLGEDWETCMTINDTWGFKKDDERWKSTRTLVRNLIDIASKGGNYLVNVGPTAEGEIPAPSIERLVEVGQWMKSNGEAIYGTTPAPFKKQPLWGRVTRKGSTLFLHVFDWPTSGKLLLSVSNTGKAAMVSNPSASLEAVKTEQGLEITLPVITPDPIATVISVELEGDIQELAPPPLQQAADGAVVLLAATATITGQLAIEGGDQPNIGFWINARDSVEWKVAITAPGVFEPVVTYACPADTAGSEFVLVTADQTVMGTVGATGGWGDYSTTTLPKVRFDKPDTYTISIKPTYKKAGAIMNLRNVTLKPVNQ